MEPLIKVLRKEHPELKFTEGDMLCWSPKTKEIHYCNSSDSGSILGVLHEIGHATLNHSTYKTDLELLQKEVLAWEQALKLAEKYQVPLQNAPSHVEDCLDTYREWLYRRSLCPTCGMNGVQKTTTRYICTNCTFVWRVSPSRFCRPYRNKTD